MKIETFHKATAKFIDGPEHNAYYDVKEILDICLEVMTPRQRRSVVYRLRKRRRRK